MNLDVFVGRLTAVDHESIDELHGLRSLATELAGHDDLASLRSALHDETEDAVACSAGTSQHLRQLQNTELDTEWPAISCFYSPTHGKSTDKLVTERLGLSDGAETAGSDLFGVQLNGVLGEVETLLNDGGEFTNATAPLAQNIQGTGGEDDDLRAGGGDANLQ